MTTDKFKFKFKLTGLEFEVEGTKEYVTQVTTNIGNQLKGLTHPPMMNPQHNTEDISAIITDETQKNLGNSKRKRNRKPKSTGQPDNSITTLDFKSDPQNYGAPVSTWTTAKKSMWLLYVIKNVLAKDELSANEIAHTFNKHYKQAKIIQHNNVSRDLGKNKLGHKALVGENTSQTPSLWYLTDEGNKSVQALISEQQTSNGTN